MGHNDYTSGAVLKPGAIFLTLNLADIAITAFLLSFGASELNPIYAYLGSIYLLAVAKLALVCLVLLGLLRFNQLHLLKWLNAGLGLIVVWNIIAAVTWLV